MNLKTIAALLVLTTAPAIAQDEASSLVYGMPKVAAATGSQMLDLRKLFLAYLKKDSKCGL